MLLHSQGFPHSRGRTSSHSLSPKACKQVGGRDFASTNQGRAAACARTTAFSLCKSMLHLLWLVSRWKGGCGVRLKFENFKCFRLIESICHDPRRTVRVLRGGERVPRVRVLRGAPGDWHCTATSTSTSQPRDHSQFSRPAPRGLVDIPSRRMEHLLGSGHGSQTQGDLNKCASCERQGRRKMRHGPTGEHLAIWCVCMCGHGHEIYDTGHE